MRFLFLGDIMGASGRTATLSALPTLRAELRLDFVVLNVENAAGGRGITPKIADELFAGGADVLTGGNHSWDRREIIPYIKETPRLLRPLNLAGSPPGVGVILVECEKVAGDGGRVPCRLLVVNVMTRLFMEPSDDPFAAVAGVLADYRLGRDVEAILVDVHGEATGEKAALGHYLDGRVTAVLGTHTHIPTADGRVLANGTAFQSDVGMCGDYDSVIGLEKGAAVQRWTDRARAPRADAASGYATLCGVVVETAEETGLATRLEPLILGGCLAEAYPEGLTYRLPTSP